jgi:hypothetical protein
MVRRDPGATGDRLFLVKSSAPASSTIKHDCNLMGLRSWTLAEEEKEINLRLQDYEKPGLYLTFEDSSQIVLTRGNIEKTTEEYWKDPDKIPPDVRKAAEFQRCGFCPLKGTETFCDALRPILPLLSVIDDYHSFDKVTAIYTGDEKGLYHVSDTTMQRALRDISNLSLMEYCQVGRKYHKYYYGIIPVMETEQIANSLYLNMYWIHRGDEQKIDKLIFQMNKEITMTTENQMRRLRLICKSDAFLNAFILTHLVTDVLFENKDTKLREQLEGPELQ